MIDGLWTVEFISTLNRIGKGILVLTNGRIFGGDSGYYYLGNYKVDGDNTITGNINVVRFDINSVSVLGDSDQLSLKFSGVYSANAINGTASLTTNQDIKIKIICNKKEDFK